MLKLVLLALTFGAIAAASESEWSVFKATHGKLYDGEMDAVRRTIWEENLQKIQKHNEKFARGESTYYLGENQFADMTTSEAVKVMNGYKGVPKKSGLVHTVGSDPTATEVDWRTKGYVTAIKNQGQCGSCWSFSATGSMEGQHFKKTGQLVSLSEKNLMDCSKKFGNDGCEGGLMDNAFRYIISNKGIDTEASYPYKPVDGKCRFKRRNVGANETSFKDIEQGSEDALKDAVATVGPISVAIDASQGSFQLYKGGVYNEPECSSTALDHGVLAVGYGTKDGQDYWLVKNSWGTKWGIEGYIMMSRNKQNQCGIATQASYPIV